MKKGIIILLNIFLSVNAFAQIDLVRKAAEGGDVDAQKYLGEIFFVGKDGVKKDTQESYNGTWKQQNGEMRKRNIR